MLRILANDGMDKAAVDYLRGLGHEVSTDHLEGTDLENAIKEYDVLVVRSATKVRKPLIDIASEAGQLKLIVRAGVGIDNIDHEYAEQKCIAVRNTPKASSASVAELTIAHMFAVSRFINISNVTMRRGEWNKKAYKGVELMGKTLGLIGFGRIGQEVGSRARALGMDVIYSDHHVHLDSPQYKKVEMDELLEKSDYVSLHVPFLGTPVLDEKEFAQMKDGVRIINVARGGVVSEDALLAALESGKVAAAALDVFEEEPTKREDICNHPAISVTPHIGASTNEAQLRIGIETYETILDFFTSKVGCAQD